MHATARAEPERSDARPDERGGRHVIGGTAGAEVCAVPGGPPWERGDRELPIVS
jgi:hypothetical protein